MTPRGIRLRGKGGKYSARKPLCDQLLAVADKVGMTDEQKLEMLRELQRKQQAARTAPRESENG